MCRRLPSLLRSSTLFVCTVLFVCLIPTGLSDPLKVYCPFTANYTNHSTFQSNLNALLSNLSAGGPLTGFSNDTRGAGADRVYGLSLCRGDIDADICQTCLNNATGDVTSGCQNRKTATVWYDDCLLRYSERSFFSTVDTSYVLDIPDPNNASEPDQFSGSLTNLTGELAMTAAYRQPGRMFHTGSVSLNGSRTLYGLVQCTRDLSDDQCSDCLKWLISLIPKYFGGKEGGRLFGLNCVLRFEVFQFFKESDAIGTPSSPPPPPATPAGSVPAPSAETKKKNEAPIVVLIAVLLALVALVVGISGYVWMKKRKTIANIFDAAEEDELRHDECMSFDLRTLKMATNNFSYENKLGEGGFGHVYKGVLPGGQQIAIKMLSGRSRHGLRELRNEIDLIARLQHRNLVRLLGYCLEEQANLLIYEYLPNKSLDKFLFDPTRGRQLNWERRYNIIEGIARGLLYLHEDSRLRVIHRDLKAANILLDREMNPKISDFGLAKLFGTEQSQGNTSRVVGTYGYMAPEYVIHGRYSKKSDIYSFGIIVLEIITGRQSIKSHGSGRASTITGYVWQHWIEGTIIEVLDQSVVEGCLMEQLSRCVHIGLLCVQEDPYQRPSIASVLLMLSSDAIALPAISEPAFAALGGTTTGSNSSTTGQDISSPPYECLINEISSH